MRRMKRNFTIAKKKTAAETETSRVDQYANVEYTVWIMWTEKKILFLALLKRILHFPLFWLYSIHAANSDPNKYHTSVNMLFRRHHHFCILNIRSCNDVIDIDPFPILTAEWASKIPKTSFTWILSPTRCSNQSVCVLHDCISCDTCSDGLLKWQKPINIDDDVCCNTCYSAGTLGTISHTHTNTPIRNWHQIQSYQMKLNAFKI